MNGFAVTGASAGGRCAGLLCQKPYRQNIVRRYLYFGQIT